MNNHLFLLGFIAGAVSLILLGYSIWIAVRVIKTHGRRCRKTVPDPDHPGKTKPCGKLTKRHTLFARVPGETITWFDSDHHFRTHIFGFPRLVYAECEDHHARFVKVDTDPLDNINAHKLLKRHPEQFEGEEQTFFSADRSMSQMLGRDPKFNAEHQLEGTPPLSLTVSELIQGMFNELGEQLKSLIEGPHDKHKE